MHLKHDCETLKIIQLNTDGIMISFDEKEYPKVLEITMEWQKRTGFELEEDTIKKIAQKDVNNYVEVATNGKSKIKGGMLVRGIAPAGAFKINNDAVIVAEALKQYFVDGTTPEEIIGNCDDLLKFQLIAKASHKYTAVYQVVNGELIEVQRCNRVYATKNTQYGTLYKKHGQTGKLAKVAGLPPHCLIDNSNKLTITDIDKEWYVRLAKYQIAEFIGVKGNKMAEVKENVYSKLLSARKQFIEANVQKTGKNPSLMFKYFELADIVPIATEIFSKVGLIGLVKYTEESASMDIVNIEKPTEIITFTTPMRYADSNRGTNAVMALGSTHTYLRRYLYMAALDICENDSVDADPNEGESFSEPNKPIEKKPKKKVSSKSPHTAEERKSIADAITGADDLADSLQIDGLKNACKALKAKDASYAQMVKSIQLEATSGKMTKTRAEELIGQIQDALSE